MKALAPLDEKRERLICAYRVRMEVATNREEKRFWWERMRSEINSRSAEQVWLMEIERGLR